MTVWLDRAVHQERLPVQRLSRSLYKAERDQRIGYEDLSALRACGDQRFTNYEPHLRGISKIR